MTVTDRRALLAENYLFQGLDGPVIDSLVHLSVTKKLAANETLFQKGDSGDALYGVIKGRVRISITSSLGKTVTLNLIEPGSVFGEIAMIDGLPRTADASAASACELLMIRRRDFIPFMERNPNVATHLLQLLCARLRWTSDLVEDAAFLSVPARLAKKLLRLSELFGEPGANGGTRIGMHLPQHELGHMMATSRESINKHLQIWRREGWIELDRGTVTVMNADALQEVVDNELV